MNFVGQIQQSVGPNQYPVQTINFNQPQGKNMTVQNISLTESQPMNSNMQTFQYPEQQNVPVQQTSYMIINPTI